MDKRIIIINGSNFSNPEGFYDEIDNVMTAELGWDTGHNLDSFNELLRGGFGVLKYEEPIKLIRQNSDKSIKDPGSLRNGQITYQILVDTIKEHTHIDFFET